VPANRNDPVQFAKDVAELPRLAKVGVALGCPRATTGIMPGSNDLPYAENYARTLDQFKRIA
jgi:hypothetical protein